MSEDYDPAHYVFSRRAKRTFPGILEFDNATPPLRPFWRDLAWIAGIALILVCLVVFQ